jgi:catechol 2,3-dioxygenase-like lactoylglutathione lyase family enzyme
MADVEDHAEVPAQQAGRLRQRYAGQQAAEQNMRPPRNSDVGGHHVALYVEDLDAAVAHLHALRLTVLGEPTASTGPSEGQRWIYFLSPWGMRFELVSYPGGEALGRGFSTGGADDR